MGKRSLPHVLGAALTSRLPDVSQPRPGTILTRSYKTKTIVVTVKNNGFEYDGSIYRSLTAVAKKVTGSHWNGKHFFGLTGRRKSA